MKIGIRAILLGWFLTVAFSIITIYLEMVIKSGFTVTDTLIPVLSYFFLVVVLLIINPILKAIHYSASKIKLFRPFNRHEILLIFVMTIVTSGISSYGLIGYFVPFIGSINDPARNTSQSDWGLLSQTVLEYEEDGITKKIYGDIENQTDTELVLRIYGPKKSQDRLVAFKKADVKIQKPLIKPEMVLNRDDSEIFTKGLPQEAIVNEETGKTEFYNQNALPYFLPMPGEEFSGYRKRMREYLDSGEMIKGYSFWGGVPWGKVIPPFAYWLIFILSVYLALISLAKIFFTQWAKYERLQFPLASIPQEALGDIVEGENNEVPDLRIWKNPYFIVGFLIAGICIVLSSFKGLNFHLMIDVRDYVEGTIFEGLKDAKIQFYIFFVLLGVAYIVPSEISFSVWFFGLVFVLEVLLAIWFGFGQSFGSFGTDYFTQISFYNAQALGGVIVFSSFALWNVRHYMLAVVYKVLGLKPKSVSEEIVRENTLASGLFIIAGLGIFSFMLWLNISFWWAVVYCSMTLLFTITAMRVASECGIIGFQNLAAGGNHLAANVIGIKNLGVTSFINIIIIQMVFFFDTKAYLAPNAMVAQKIQDESGASKKIFWSAIFVAILLALISSFWYCISLVYSEGSKNLESWYYQSIPKMSFDVAVQFIKSSANEPMVNINGATAGFIIFGMVFMSALLFARTKWFWVPHPVGFLLWISHAETKYFLFCFFLGWCIKYVVVKFGTKETIDNMKKWAIGLILGHITAIIIIGMLKLFNNLPVEKINLNFH